MIKIHLTRCRIFVAVLALLILLPPAYAAPDGATVTYRRVFKGSTPELIEIKIPEQGNGTFEIRQLSEEAGAESFEVGPAVRGKIFELAGALKHFDIPSLDVPKRIANLGQKTFRYQNGAETHETTFNYTLDPNATQLVQIFEGLAKQQGDLVTLERSAKYDRLGVNDALREFESDLDHRALPEPERFLPTLDQIAGDSRFLEIARNLARALAARIRGASDR